MARGLVYESNGDGKSALAEYNEAARRTKSGFPLVAAALVYLNFLNKIPTAIFYCARKPPPPSERTAFRTAAARVGRPFAHSGLRQNWQPLAHSGRSHVAQPIDRWSHSLRPQAPSASSPPTCALGW
eukprot:6184933-Prymnesium_polylepis.2